MCRVKWTSVDKKKNKFQPHEVKVLSTASYAVMPFFFFSLFHEKFTQVSCRTCALRVWNPHLLEGLISFWRVFMVEEGRFATFSLFCFLFFFFNTQQFGQYFTNKRPDFNGFEGSWQWQRSCVRCHWDNVTHKSSSPVLSKTCPLFAVYLPRFASSIFRV